MDITDLKPKEITALYDRIYAIADKQIKRHNPCGIYVKDNVVFCNYYSKQYKAINKENQKQGRYLCCSKCKHSSKTGCTTQNLACKLYNCDYMATKVAKRLRKLQNMLSKYSLYGRCYISREEYLKRLLSYRKSKLAYKKQRKQKIQKQIITV